MSPLAVTTTGWLLLVPLALAGLVCVVVGFWTLHTHDEDRRGRQRWWLVAALLVVAPLGVFALLAEDVATAEGIGWDASIMQRALDHQSAALTTLMRAITTTGNGLAVSLTLAAVALLLLVARLRWQAAFLVTATAAAMIVNSLMKQVFQRARPEVIPHVQLHSYAFPSGHTMSAMGFAVALIVVFRTTRWRWVVAVVGLVWAVAVGLSRVYLGFHYPSDVVAGWALAVAVVGIVWLLFWVELEAAPAEPPDAAQAGGPANAPASPERPPQGGQP